MCRLLHSLQPVLDFLCGFRGMSTVEVDRSTSSQRGERLQLRPDTIAKLEVVFVWLSPAYGGPDFCAQASTRPLNV
jgi:hypothetical protein